MKQLSLSSSHPLLAVARYGGISAYSSTDLCNLFWHTLWGALRAPVWVTLFGSLGAGVLFVMVVQPLIELYFCLAFGLEPTEALIVPAMLWASAVVLFAGLWYSISGTTEPVRGTFSQGYTSVMEFMTAGYRSWKDKTCVLVDIKTAP